MPPPVKLTTLLRNAATSCTTRVCSLQCWNFAGEALLPEPCGNVFMNITRRSGSGNGTGFSRTAFTTEKIAAFAPIPTASVRIATIVKPGAFASVLTP